MSKDLDRLLKIGTDGPAVEVKRKRNAHPQGWEQLVISERGGYITTPPQATPPENWDAFLAELLPEGMNPEDYEVDGASVEMRAWDGNIGEGEIKRFYYFKARLRRKSLLIAGVNLDDIIKAAKSAKPVKGSKKPANSRTYWLHVTDLQAGQGDGVGVAGMVSKALQLADLALSDLADLEKSGKPASSIFIPVTGDLVEGIEGWYANQTFTVQLDRRDQVKLVRRLLTEFLLKLETAGLPIHVAAVPGNHGENRQAGKSFTSYSDNDDLALVEQIAEAFQLAGKKITFSFPQKERLSLTVEVQGYIVGLTHGHVARSAGSVEAKILDWFKKMAATRDPIGDSEILFTGHYHHAIYKQLVGNTEWVQGGALCDTSAWFSQSMGLVNDPVVMRGTITREQKLEWIAPYRWPRSEPESRTIDRHN
jgi:predicted phosphodiesterase